MCEQKKKFKKIIEINLADVKNKSELAERMWEILDDKFNISSLENNDEFMKWFNDFGLRCKEEDLLLGLSGVEPERLELWKENENE